MDAEGDQKHRRCPKRPRHRLQRRIVADPVPIALDKPRPYLVRLFSGLDPPPDHRAHVAGHFGVAVSNRLPLAHDAAERLHQSSRFVFRLRVGKLFVGIFGRRSQGIGKGGAGE